MERPSGTRLAVLSLVVLGLGTAAVFGSTYGAYLAAANAPSVTAEATSYTLTEEHLVVEVELTNPTGEPIRFFSGFLVAQSTDGVVLTKPAGLEIEDVTVPAGESRRTTARLPINPDQRSTAEEVYRTGEFEVNGRLNAAIRERTLRIQVNMEGAPND